MLRSPIGSKVLLSTTVTGTTGQTGAMSVNNPDFDAALFTLACSSISGTAATLDVWVQGTLDGGNTWYDMLRFPRVTASSVNPLMGIASALGGNSMIGTVGPTTISSTAGGVGMPMVSNFVNVFWSLTGTTPTAAVTVTARKHQFDRGGI